MKARKCPVTKFKTSKDNQLPEKIAITRRAIDDAMRADDVKELGDETNKGLYECYFGYIDDS